MLSLKKHTKTKGKKIEWSGRGSSPVERGGVFEKLVFVGTNMGRSLALPKVFGTLHDSSLPLLAGISVFQSSLPPPPLAVDIAAPSSISVSLPNMVKTRNSGRVTAKLVFFLCVTSFLLGVVFTNRLRSPSESNGALVTIRRHNQELEILYEDCSPKKKPGYEEGVMDQVRKTHEVIESLDKSVNMLQMELAATRNTLVGGTSIESAPESAIPSSDGQPRKRMLMVIGINTAFSSRRRRDSVRETWMPQGKRLLKLEKEKGVVVRFTIGRTAKPNSILDQAIASEDDQHHDFLRLDHIEGYHELSAKTKIFFSTAVAKWDADFYVKVDDDVHVNLGQLAAKLEHHRTKSRVYIGCMKSGPVLSEKSVKYHEPEFWKFGEEGNKYFRHATGQIYAISRDLATFISMNRPILHRYANEDVSLGSWFIGLDVEHIDDRSLCCGTPPDCELKAQAGNMCVASFDWHCSGICESVKRLKQVHEKCGEGDLVWGDL